MLYSTILLKKGLVHAFRQTIHLKSKIFYHSGFLINKQTNMKTKLLLVISMFILFVHPDFGYGQVPNLRTVSNFILFTSNGAMTNTGATVTGGGSIGTDIGGITGFIGDMQTEHIQDTETKQCSIDLHELYEEIDEIPTTRVIDDVDLPLRDTYTAGVYKVGKAVTLGTTLTLDAQNNPDALFIFKITGAFSAAAGRRILLINGALPKNVYFNIDGAISFGAAALMKGTFISKSGAIDFATEATLEGRALTLTGAVSLYHNLVMNVFTQVPFYILTQPDISHSTGSLTILNPKAIKMTYSIDGKDYSNTTGIFTMIHPGCYSVTAKDSLGCISAGSTIKIIPFINLGINSEFAIFTTTGDILNTGDSTQVTGNVGNKTGDINFGKGKVCGQIHSGDTISGKASLDLIDLNNNLTNNASDSTISTTFGYGQVLCPRVYSLGAALVLTGELTLDAQGDPNALFIFKIGGAFKTAPNSKIILKNGASMCNIYWQVVGAITIEENSDFRGNIVCTGAIILEDSSSLHGRALSIAGAITLEKNVKVNILPSPTVTVIQPTNKINTGTITITAPIGSGITYSIESSDHIFKTNSNGVFTVVPQGTYIVTARNLECSSCPGTIVIIGQPTWTGSVSNVWNNPSNWSPASVPTADQDIIIPNVQKNPVINLMKGLTAVCNNLTIEQGVVFTIFPGNVLSVIGSITNKAGTSGLVIKASPIDGVSNGTLIFNNSQKDSVPGTVEMYSKASWDKTQGSGSIYKWQYFGIPVRSVIANPTFAGSYVRKSYESGNTSATRWVQLQNDSMLTSFTGYEIVQEKPSIYTFTGLLENQSITKSFTYTDGATYIGQHLIVNPYTAAIDISKLKFGNAMEASVYLYNTGSMADWGNSIALQYDSAGCNPGQYMVSTVFLAGKALGLPSQIPSMQAFLVKATSNSVFATLNIPYQSVVLKNDVKQTAPGIKEKTSQSKNVYTRIDVKGSRFADKMWIFTVPSCSHDFDNGWDGRKYLGSPLTPQLFAMEDDENYQINAVDDINNSYLGFMAGEDTGYELTFTHENMESLNSKIYLEDMIQNKVVEITKSGTSYSFESHKSEPLKRFKIMTNPLITDLGNTKSELNIFSSQKNIYIQNSTELKGNVKVFDMTGRCRQTSTFNANGITVLKTDLPTGAYIIQTQLTSGIVQKQLVLI
jgi:hypothetical protein